MEVLGDCIDVYVIIYLDNILIFLRSKEEYKKYIYMIMDCLVIVELYSNIKKYCFFREEIEFLGFLVRRKGV
jgi:uncharacterized membrane protein (DUF373 family)